jgi:hypothetical protein
MTLTACYGAPTPSFTGVGGGGGRVDFPTCDELAETLRTPDLDQDQYCGVFDCDEKDAKVNVAAVDVPGDGIDQNCNGSDTPAPDADAGR